MQVGIRGNFDAQAGQDGGHLMRSWGGDVVMVRGNDDGEMRGGDGTLVGKGSVLVGSREMGRGEKVHKGLLSRGFAGFQGGHDVRQISLRNIFPSLRIENNLRVFWLGVVLFVSVCHQKKP